jgi:hypothetical protein
VESARFARFFQDHALSDDFDSDDESDDDKHTTLPVRSTRAIAKMEAINKEALLRRRVAPSRVSAPPTAAFAADDDADTDERCCGASSSSFHTVPVQAHDPLRAEAHGPRERR